MRRLRLWLAAMVFALSVGGTATAVMVPATSFAACSNGSFLTLPTWYRGLQNADCSIMSPTGPGGAGGIGPFIWKIVLNIIDIILNLTAYVAVGYIIFGGFKYMLASGSSDGIAKAKSTIMNAVIGLVISIAAIAIVNLIAGAF